MDGPATQGADGADEVECLAERAVTIVVIVVPAWDVESVVLTGRMPLSQPRRMPALPSTVMLNPPRGFA